ncbi:hypothetical protein ZIOFF_045913 [Zingiber officinale]|uniref:S-acyltransferase n=1 Tax=Zingiber officinale TaxID=94328 RepID=A0A8J5G437_ZINOF|nr:hypothetical protein ZIOFF_045913 [Zingiber officinale]
MWGETLVSSWRVREALGRAQRGMVEVSVRRRSTSRQKRVRRQREGVTMKLDVVAREGAARDCCGPTEGTASLHVACHERGRGLVKHNNEQQRQEAWGWQATDRHAVPCLVFRLVVASLLAGASIFHNISKPNLVLLRVLPSSSSLVGAPPNLLYFSISANDRSSRKKEWPFGRPDPEESDNAGLEVPETKEIAFRAAPIYSLLLLPRSLLSIRPSIGALALSVHFFPCHAPDRRRRLGVSASAPALVLFNVLFMWGVYVTIIRKAIPSLLDAVLNAVCALLLYGLYRILSGDLGTVSYSSSTLESGQNEFVTLNVQCESSPTLPRVRYCKSCKASIKGFDNHCPAFGNCIGNKNHRLLIVLLAGFLIAESSYTMSSTKFLTKTADAQRIELGHQYNAFLYTPSAMAGVVPDMAHLLHLFQHQIRAMGKFDAD